MRENSGLNVGKTGRDAPRRGRAGWVVVIALALLGILIPTVRSQSGEGYWYAVRAIDATDLSVFHPVGLAYSAAVNRFLALGRDATASGDSSSTVALFTPLEDPAGTNGLAATVADPINAAFTGASGRLLALDSSGDALTQMDVGSDGLRPPLNQAVARRDTRFLRLADPQGVTVDEAGGRLFILDAAGPTLLEVKTDLANPLAAARSVLRTRLRGLGGAPVRGLAFNPANGHLYVGAAGELHEVTARGRVLARYDLSELALVDAQGMVFAPSADATDDPAIMSLFLADSGGAQNNGRVVEISFVEPPALDISPAAASLVQTIDTSKAAWSPSAPDPAGIAYRPSVNRLLISDSEVEEAHPDYQGYNVFQSTLGGGLDQTSLCATIGFSVEPNGAAVNPGNDHIFFADDNLRRIFEVNLVDGIYCNGNDTVTFLSTLTYGSGDPEGVAYGDNKLFISDGVNRQVYVVDLGPDGVVGGGDNFLYTEFDTEIYGSRDPEGIEYNPDTNTVFVVSTILSDDFLLELTPTGSLIRIYDLTFLGRVPRSGLAMAPGSQNPSVKNIYLASRGVDNNTDPIENDGKVYEISLGATPPPTVTPTFGPTNTPTLTPPATDTPQPTATNTPEPIATDTPEPTATNTPQPTATNTPPPTATSIPTATPLPSPTPPPPSGPISLSLINAGPTVVGNLSGVMDEDIIALANGVWSMVLDGSDVGLSNADVEGFAFLDADSILFSITPRRSITGAGTVELQDIVRFDATSLGNNTAGAFSLYFDGSDVGLAASSEGIDAIERLSDGRILISTTGAVSVPGVSGEDEDVLAFTPTSLGANTAGSWAMYFDGSDVGLTNGEDLDGLSLAANGRIYLSAPGNFTVPGLSGANEDVFGCTPSTLGNNTACTYESSLYFDGSWWALGGDDVDAFEVP